MAHYFTDNRNLDENRKEHTFRFLDRLYIFTTDNGVFSKTGVDYGSYVLLKAISKEELHGKVLDMGCGYGTLGIITKSLFPSSEITMVDINPRAVELTQLNCNLNQVECTVLASDGYAEINGQYHFIITNPPIRTGKKVIYKMFEDAYNHLEVGGSIYAVIRKQQGAESAKKKFAEVFGNCEVISKDRGYYILQSRKLTE